MLMGVLLQSDPFFEELKDWSELKLTILHKYVTPYCYKLGSRAPEIYYIDGFAGIGIYEDGSKGSSMLVADLAMKFRAEGRRFILKCINVENNPSHFAELSKNTERFGAALVTNLYGSFSEHIPTILETIGSCPALFFIDPYGLAPIKFGNLRPIFRRTASTEILINFSRKGLQRLAGNLDAEPETEKGKKAAETKVRTLTEVLDTDGWKEIWRHIDEPSLRDRMILDLYREKLYEHFVHIYPVEIKTEFKSSPKYYLVYATSKYDGVEFINDFVYDIQKSLFLQAHPIFRDLPIEKELTKLKAEIYDYGRKKGKLTLSEIREHFIPDRFSRLKVKHYNQLVRELWKEGGKIRKSGDKAIRDGDVLKFV